jgi:anti-sigma regulatory factor (Ser/Thr protein kinase)
MNAGMRHNPHVSTQGPTDAGDESLVTTTVELPYGADAAAIARRFVADHADHLDPDLIEDARLLVSEIVTNAVRYGQPEITLMVHLTPPTIGVAVADEGDARPTRPGAPPPPTQPSGRGLLLVDALASVWGVSDNPVSAGKTVWFTLTDTTWRQP